MRNYLQKDDSPKLKELNMPLEKMGISFFYSERFHSC